MKDNLAGNLQDSQTRMDGKQKEIDEKERIILQKILKLHH